MISVISLLRILCVALHTIFWSVPVLLLSFSDPYAKRSARLVRLWAQGNLWMCGVKVRTRGYEQLDPQGVYIFMANHQSQFDILALTAALSAFQVRWVAKRELRRVPLLGLCVQRTRQILVDRDSHTQALATLRQIKTLLNAGISVVFFPEGTRSKDGRLLPFKPGGFAVAVEMGVPVVPVTINGSHAIMPSGDWKVRAGEIEVVLSEPIRLDPCVNKKAARRELLVAVQEAIAASYEVDAPTALAPTEPLVKPSSVSHNRTAV